MRTTISSQGSEGLCKTQLNRLPDTPITVFYAFKQSEADAGDADDISSTASTGWEKMLEG